MTLPIRGVLRAALEETTDETIRKMQKSAKLIQNRDVIVELEESSGTELDGVIEWDKDNNVRVSTSAGGAFPVSGIPVEARAGVEVSRSFQAVGSMNVKISIESTVRVRPKE